MYKNYYKLKKEKKLNKWDKQKGYVKWLKLIKPFKLGERKKKKKQ